MKKQCAGKKETSFIILGALAFVLLGSTVVMGAGEPAQPGAGPDLPGGHLRLRTPRRRLDAPHGPEDDAGQRGGAGAGGDPWPLTGI